MFNSVKTARRHGYNVRQGTDGWQVAKLTINGWDWSYLRYPTKVRALKAAWFRLTEDRVERAERFAAERLAS